MPILRRGRACKKAKALLDADNHNLLRKKGLAISAKWIHWLSRTWASNPSRRLRIEKTRDKSAAVRDEIGFSELGNGQFSCYGRMVNVPSRTDERFRVGDELRDVGRVDDVRGQ